MTLNSLMILICGMVILFFEGLTLGKVISARDCDYLYSLGSFKVFTWSDVSELNAELAKGYKIRRTYDVTNMVLEKVEKK